MFRRMFLRGCRAGVAALGALVAIAIAPSAHAQATLDFERCAEPAGDWECATHTVPLDRSGAVPGAIDLAVRRHRPAGTPDPSDRPPFVFLAGGPGESAIGALVPGIEAILEPALEDYQLVIYDQRGTGLSGPLECPALGGPRVLSDPILDDSAARPVARCAEQLGPRRAFYTTLDSVADIDSLRDALGADTMGIGGVSYGTYVSAVYAQQHPQRTERIVLDSVISPAGREALQEPVFAAIPRVVAEQCDDGACRGVTSMPRGDLGRVAAQLRGGRIAGVVRDRDGRRDRTALEGEAEVVTLMLMGDINPSVRAAQPAALRAAARGDAAPLLRLARVAGVSGQGGAGAQVAGINQPLFHSTTCTDLVLPWPAHVAPGGERNRLYRNALWAVPQSLLRPFGRPALRGTNLAAACRLWPLTDSAPPPDHLPLPDVPTLIVNGKADLRTPISKAIEAQRDFAPGASLLLVEGQGHSVLLSVGCARTALARFFADRPIGDPCAGVDRALPVQPLAPRHVRQVRRAPGTRGPRGRTLGAVLATIGDLRWLGDVHARQRFRIGGLRHGWVALQPRRPRFVLRQLAYVPGVRVSGNLRVRRDNRLVGRLRVRGPRAVNGTVRFRPDGRLVGRLRGERIVTADRTR